MRHLAFSVATLAFLVGTTEVVRADCKPAAIPMGEASLVRSVSERLTANGVSTVPAEGCPAVRVHLERRGEQLHLRVADGYQRRGEREVRDIATAAALIESWTLQEVEEGALPEMAPQPAVTATAATSVPQPERFGIALGGLSAIASDGTAWLGGEVTGCARVSWFCLGVATSLSTTTAGTQDYARGTQRSVELHALVTVDLPMSFGAFTVSPGIGLGYGWMSFAQQHMDMHTQPLSVEYSSHALRTRAHVALSRELAGRMSIFASMFGDAAALRTEIPAGPTSAPAARLGLTIGLRLGL